MSAALKACLIVYWLSLAAWLTALAAGGLAAANVFGTLPGLDVVLPRFAAYPESRHGTLAAGLVMAEVFFALDVVRLIAVPLAVVTLLLQVTVFRLPLRRPAHVVRGACVVAAAGAFAWYAFAVAPLLRSTLTEYRQAAEAGDLERVADARQRFDGGHRAAERISRVNLVLVAGAVAASAAAFAPATARTAAERRA